MSIWKYTEYEMQSLLFLVYANAIAKAMVQQSSKVKQHTNKSVISQVISETRGVRGRGKKKKKRKPKTVACFGLRWECSPERDCTNQGNRCPLTPPYGRRQRWSAAKWRWRDEDTLFSRFFFFFFFSRLFFSPRPMGGWPAAATSIPGHRRRSTTTNYCSPVLFFLGVCMCV